MSNVAENANARIHLLDCLPASTWGVTHDVLVLGKTHVSELFHHVFEKLLVASGIPRSWVAGPMSLLIPRILTGGNVRFEFGQLSFNVLSCRTTETANKHIQRIAIDHRVAIVTFGASG